MRIMIAVFSKFTSLFVVLLIATSVSVNAKQLIFAAEDNAPPYSDKNGRGISFDIINEVFAGSDYQVTYISVPYARAIQMVKHGQVDGAFNVTHDLDEKINLLFGHSPLVSARAFLYLDAKDEEHALSIEDLPDNTSIGVMIGFEYGATFNQHKHRFDLIQVSSQRQLIELLMQKRISRAIMYERVAAHTLSEMALPDDAIQRGALVSQNDAYLVINKDKGYGQEVIDFFDNRLAKLKASGRYLQLINR